VDEHPTKATLRAYREALIDAELMELRERYCRTVVSALSAVSGLVQFGRLARWRRRDVGRADQHFPKRP
jgi:hypothetical protein